VTEATRQVDAGDGVACEQDPGENRVRGILRAAMPVNPYAPPATVDSPPAFEGIAFKSTTPLASALTVVMLVGILTILLGMVSNTSVIRDGGAAMTVVPGKQPEVPFAPLDMIIGGVSLLVAIAEVVLFCLFMPRANRNARWFRSPMSIAPGWAAGFFFVPVVNLWKPYQAMKEIWQGSDPDPNIEARQVRVPWLLRCWWATYLGTYLSVIFVMRAQGRISDPASWVHASQIQLATSFVSIASAATAIALVRAVARRQDQRQSRDNP
jgi:Domain of unknown function (DUF4328)